MKIREKKFCQLTLDEVKKIFPDALKNMTKDSKGNKFGKMPSNKYLNEHIFWTDSHGRLHVDDVCHPAFDDIYVPEFERWDGSGEIGPERSDW